jgi:hypothetical protein
MDSDKGSGDPLDVTWSGRDMMATVPAPQGGDGWIDEGDVCQKDAGLTELFGETV